MTRRIFHAAALGALGAGMICGQAPRGQMSPALASREQRGRQILQQALAALGGPAYLGMRDRTEVGRAYSFYREQLTGLSVAHFYIRYRPAPVPAPPDFMGIEERQSFGKKQDNSVIFAQNQGFDVTFRGARPLPDERLQRYQESMLSDILYILYYRLHEPGLQVLEVGADVVENQRVNTVEIADRQNRSVIVHFSAGSHLPVAQRRYRRDPMFKERIEEVTRYSEYVAVPGGVMWPKQISREREGEKIYQMFAESVQINTGLDESLFRLPSGIPILKKQAI
ncbi:MAG TPA: hypothetical protein DEQ47_03950 [Solibacterales bacterium]|nr:hypothetical protein [Bryobacterales bacterium]